MSTPTAFQFQKCIFCILCLIGVSYTREALELSTDRYAHLIFTIQYFN